MSDLFRTTATVRAMPTGTPLRSAGVLAAILVGTMALCVGCSKNSEGDGRAKRAAPVLTDENMERLLGAIQDLKALGIAQATARAIEEGIEDPHIHGPVGVGMSEWVEGSAPILKRWGFHGSSDFESLHGYAILALNQIVLGKDGGVQQASKGFYLQQGIAQQRNRIAEVKSDESLSRAERDRRISDSERAIAEAEDTLAEDAENAEMMIGQSEGLPPQNVVIMEKYKERYLKLKIPHG